MARRRSRRRRKNPASRNFPSRNNRYARSVVGDRF